MKVFISWSGPRSRKIAEQLHRWLPYMLQPIKPFMSSGDIRKGTRWGDVLAQELEDTEYGVVCVTQQNMLSPWLNFEAGALSNTAGHGCVSPVLFGVEPAKLVGPLSQFQTTSFAEDGKEMLGLVCSINQNFPDDLRVPRDILEGTFRRWWRHLRPAIKNAMKTDTGETETGLEWLYSVADFATLESGDAWGSVMVINPDPLKDWHLLKETVQKNLLKRGIDYTFIVPSSQVSVLHELIQQEVDHHKGGANNSNKGTMSILSMPEAEYKRLAASHYRVLTSSSDKNQDAKVFFEIPVEPCGYWAEAKGVSAENLRSRFNRMKRDAKLKVSGSLQRDGSWQMKVVPPS